MMFEEPTEQQAQLIKWPIVISDNAWQAMNLEGHATSAQMLERRNDTIYMALEALALCTSPEVQEFYDIEVPCVVTTGDPLEDHWLQLRVVVVRKQGEPRGLKIMLRDEVFDPEQPIPGIFFQPGRFVQSKGVHALVKQKLLDPSVYLSRHLVGDWGDLDDEDKQSNKQALEHGLRLLSAYKIDAAGEDKLWIITEADRSCTTLLLPSEY
ncbi:hypothetical protein ACMGT0_20210 [Pseudomonas sp. RHF3.3-3]|uniref:Uncharacterized protein n=1 Tax=Pseudomonas asplenii TaxID=53407 RepID=A0A0M9GG40_9PSED|nr:hypothetical protein [Pseudomonas fuscovaginae]KPA90340.1 hypothetical protein PF66_03146 [Pseudomonas fuscovaginae]